MKVSVTGTGTISLLTVWLNDGVSESDIIAAGGFQLQGQLTAFLEPKMLGTWHLHARVLDLQGCASETGLVRNVTVTP